MAAKLLGYNLEMGVRVNSHTGGRNERLPVGRVAGSQTSAKKLTLSLGMMLSKRQI